MSRSAAISAVVVLAACGDEAREPDLLLPDPVAVEWEDAYNAVDDGLGALVPVDVMVYDGATGEALPDVEVVISTTDAGAVPVPVEGVLVVDGTDDGDGVAWDASRDEYVAFEPLDPLPLRTDEGGVARLYLYVDAFPEAPDVDGGFDPSGRAAPVLDYDPSGRAAPVLDYDPSGRAAPVLDYDDISVQVTIDNLEETFRLQPR